MKGCDCGAEWAWLNAVDDTNGDSYGIILDSSFDSWKIQEEKVCVCTCCGNSHIAEGAKYLIPTKQETKAARCYYDESGQFVNILTGKPQ